MPKIIITPWRDQSELVDVRSKFYPSSAASSSRSLIDLRPDACRIVEAWKLRGHLPHAVEATALLTDAILHDDATRNSVFSIRATYAAAFSRFVTGLVDTKLVGGAAAQRGSTMFTRASMIGLPLSFVELRHEAAHRELPSLVLLRSYTNRALEWLWDFYWAKIDIHAVRASTITGKDEVMAIERGDGSQEDALRAHIKYSLQQYVQQVQPDSLAGSTRKKLKNSLSLSLSQSLVSICKPESTEGVELISRVLLEDGFLVPKDRELHSPMDTAFSIWDQVLQSVSNSYSPFLSILVKEMGKEFINLKIASADPFLEGIYLWLEHILLSDFWEKECSSFVSTNLIQYLCDEFPNTWTSTLGKTLRDKNVSSTTSAAVSDQREPEMIQFDNRDIGPTQLVDDLRKYGWEFSD